MRTIPAYLITFAGNNRLDVNRYFLQLSFKGTRYAGWQIQENAISVQAVLNNALQTILRVDTPTTGCGRTDAGVHAREFYVHFDVYTSIENPSNFIYKLNSILPDDISASSLIPVESQAHSRFDATKRKYEYFLSTNKNPFLKEYTMFVHSPPELSAMNAACSILFDHNDFSAFSKSHTQVKTNLCKIYEAHWEQRDGLIVFSIAADRFLRGMVRAIVGTMLDVGSGKNAPGIFQSILESKNRSEAGVSVPASGLYLTEIWYPYIQRSVTYKFPR